MVKEADMTNYNLNNMTLIIGAGSLGSALVSGREIYGEADDFDTGKNYISIYDIDKKKKKLFKNNPDVKFIKNLSDAVKGSKIIILTVKPKDYKVVCKSIKNDIKKSTIIISLMAGIKISDLRKELFNDTKIVRVMTHIGIEMNSGTAFIYANNKINNSDKKKIDSFFGLLCILGKVHWLKSENNFDKYTALIGSGPAYVMYFGECLVKVFKKFGLSNGEANLHAALLLESSASLAKMYDSNIFFNYIKNRVASKGGTTEQALKVLQSSNFEKILEKAIRQAYSKSRNILNKKNG